MAADAREFALDERYALILAPMQLAQLLGGPEGRAGMLRCAAAHLLPGGMLAVALLAGGAPDFAQGPPPLPDVREIDGRIYSSQPLEVRGTNGGLEVKRLRQTVSPAGDLTEELDVTKLDALAPQDLEREAAERGLDPGGRIAVPPTPDHVGSTVVLLESS